MIGAGIGIPGVDATPPAVPVGGDNIVDESGNFLSDESGNNMIS